MVLRVGGYHNSTLMMMNTAGRLSWMPTVAAYIRFLIPSEDNRHLCHHFEISPTLFPDINSNIATFPLGRVTPYPSTKVSDATENKLSCPSPRHHTTHMASSRSIKIEALHFSITPVPFADGLFTLPIQRSASRANWLLARSAYYCCLLFFPTHPIPPPSPNLRTKADDPDDCLIGQPLLPSCPSNSPSSVTTHNRHFPVSWSWVLRTSPRSPDPAPEYVAMLFPAECLRERPRSFTNIITFSLGRDENDDQPISPMVKPISPFSIDKCLRLIAQARRLPT